MSSLFLSQPDGSEIEVPLGDQTMRIGRAAENEITIDESSVSTFHAEIRPDGGHHVLKDLGSTNGVRLNGERIQEAILADGDLVRFGNYRGRYQGDAPPEEETFAAAPAPSRAAAAKAPPPAAVKPTASAPPEIKALGFGPKIEPRNPDKIIATLAGLLVILTSAAAVLMAFSMH